MVGAWAIANWCYHALRKPSELLFPVSGALAKAPSETWREYGPQFRKHGTAVIRPELLAALAQIEGAGNPLARTYWRWQATWHPFELYRPASSALGMYQITYATFAQTRPECRNESMFLRDEPADELRFCWLDSLYTRLVPSHAIAFTSVHLDRAVATTLEHNRMAATLQQRQDLAAVIHLCGAGTGKAYARRHFRLIPGERCGDHDVAAYLGRVNAMKRVFARLAGAS